MSITPQSQNAAQFAEKEVVGVVLSTRTFGEDGWTIINVSGGRTVTMEVDANDSVICGVEYRFFGAWTYHDKFGAQFKAEAHVVADHWNQAGVYAYLTRSAIGLRKGQVSKLWDAFGGDTVKVLRTDPGRVAHLGLLESEVADSVSRKLEDAVADAPARIALFGMFAGHGFPRNTVAACIREWGVAAPAKVRRDPFCLITNNIPGVGFKRADKLYLAQGGNPARLKRQMLAGWHWLHTNSTGNTWERKSGFNKAVLSAAGSFDAAKFEAALTLGIRSGWIVQRAGEDVSDADDVWIAETAAAGAEERLAQHVKRVMAHKAIWPDMSSIEAKEGEPSPSPHQLERLASISGSAVAILAGTPGTGKTFTAAALLRHLKPHLAKIGGAIAVCAPTGKAAVRITEAMQKYGLKLAASTIHSLLGVCGQDQDGNFVFEHNEQFPLSHRVIVVDEGSMCDTPLMAALFAAIPAGGNILVVGDPFQLPPVGHGAPLRDLIHSGDVPCGLLTEIKRNSGRIVEACREIKDGAAWRTSESIDKDAGENLLIFPATSEQQQVEGMAGLLSHLAESCGYNRTWDVQVLCPTNEKGMVSRKPLNAALQSLLNDWTPRNDDERNPKFKVGDKVICLKNCKVSGFERRGGGGGDDLPIVDHFSDTGVIHYLANGDMGKVLATSKTHIVAEFMCPSRTVRIPTAKPKKSENGNGNGNGESSGDGSAVQFDLAYAITGHKSQGSEWPVVIVMVDPNAGPIGCREWIYTAISRARDLCFLVGREDVARRWSQRSELMARKTFLRELLNVKKDEEGASGDDSKAANSGGDDVPDLSAILLPCVAGGGDAEVQRGRVGGDGAGLSREVLPAM